MDSQSPAGMWKVMVMVAAVAAVPCRQLERGLQALAPCTCKQLEAEMEVSCDGKVFPGDMPLLPFRRRVSSFSQRHAGYQSLPAQLFTASDLPLRRLDFSHNSLRRLSDRLLDGLEDTLEEVLLGHNLLGAGLNPIFSTNELQNLHRLRVLDLQHNQLKGIEDGIFKGCHALQELHLEGNQLVLVPTGALRGPRALQRLYLQDNAMEKLHRSAFASLPELEMVDLSNNALEMIEGEAFSGLGGMRSLYLSGNKLRRLNSDAFQGLTAVQELHLSNNFLTEVPMVALKALHGLKRLSLSSNLLQTLEGSNLQQLPQLEYLDLSRNNIADIIPGTFLRMSDMKELDVSINSLRNVEDDAFEGLENLESLSLNDNNILFVPTSALERLVKLQRLSLDYNRIAVLSDDILSSIQHIQQLSLGHNVIREIPDETFRNFTSLHSLHLYGNQLQFVSQATFVGLEKTLQKLNLGYNKLNDLPKISLPVLTSLDLSKNNFSQVSYETFSAYPRLLYLNLAENNIESISVNAFVALRKLEVLHLENNHIAGIRAGTFQPPLLKSVFLQGNQLQDIDTRTFHNLVQLEYLDLSDNLLESMKPGAFYNVPALRKLLLNFNVLTSVKSDFFEDNNNSTALTHLDLSNNHIAYVYPSSFDMHPSLTLLNVSYNHFSFFPSETIRSLANLDTLDLSHNQLKSLEDADFANMPMLRSLDLSHNQLEFLSDNAFQNSSQLQFVQLANNKLEVMPENIFKGLSRLDLNLMNNNLNQLPVNIFDRGNLQRLQSINLAHNLFQTVPTDALQRQYFFLETVNLAGNKIKDIPSNTNTLVNIKYLDLSYNPLSEASIKNILNEPKTVLELNLAGTGIKKLPALETPFLRALNLTDNAIEEVNESLFERPTLLEKLDLSRNKIPNLSFGLANIWPRLKHLKEIDLSHNPISYLIRGDFNQLDSLQVLKLNHLTECNKVEKTAFASLRNLKEFSFHDYPRLGYLDSKGILENFFTLEKIALEIKDQVVGDQFHPAFFPRLRALDIHGRRVRSLSTGAFAGLNSPQIQISLRNTSVSSVPASIFFPVPMSSNISLDIRGSKFTNLGPPFIATLNNRQRHIRLQGLSTNPIACDCNSLPLQRWLFLAAAATNFDDETIRLNCSSPEAHAGKKLIEIPTSELTCHPNATTNTYTTVASEPLGNADRATTPPEPEIIWSTSPQYEEETTRKEPKNLTANQSGLNNMDTLIIAIVGGVVAFIALLIIVICIVRLRAANTQYRGGPLAGPLALRAQGKCTCLKPPPPLYGNNYMAPYPAPAYYGMGGTLPHKMPAALGPPAYGTASSRQGSYYLNPPYYVTFPPDSDADHR